MEHSLLHALELNSLFLTCGGPLLLLLFVRPAEGCATPRPTLARGLECSVARWVQAGAWAAAAATLADLVVETAELQGQTVFGSWNLGLLWTFAAHSHVGRLGLTRAGLLLLTAALARRQFPTRWLVLCALGLSALLVTALVSHAAAQPTARPVALAVQVVHLWAGAAWLGVLMHLLAVPHLSEGAADRNSVQMVARLVQLFSPWALAAVLLLAISGVAALCRSVASPWALLISAYGLTLLIKLALLGPAIYAGFLNYTEVRPGLLRLAQADPVSANTAREYGALLGRFRRLLELEVTSGVLVVVAAGVLGSIPLPNRPGDQQLTPAQTRALTVPHWPRSSFAHPASFYGAAQRTVDDLRYSEFMHNWSGLVVLCLGLCWLGRRGPHRWQWALGRAWPWLLVGFTLFIGLASDPELWLFDRVSPWQVFRDPEVFEHKLGAGLLLLLVVLAWRERAHPQDQQPLGYALPWLMICGSILLLGHAHSTLSSGEELTTLINVQHAVLGGVGLLAGTVRWMSLRQLLPGAWPARAWPLLVVSLGALMAFFYRETW